VPDGQGRTLEVEADLVSQNEYANRVEWIAVLSAREAA
jgi:hypothetical protein